MARVRYIGPEERVTVPELGDRVVEQDEVVEVPDSRFGAYVCQATNWDGVEEPADWTPPEPPTAADAPAAETAERPAPTRKSKTTAAKGDV